MSLRIALLQMASCGTDVEAAQAKAESCCRQAKALGADIALFPEMYSIGYTACPPYNYQAAAWRALSQPVTGPFVSHFRELAAELNMAIAVTYLEDLGGSMRNTVSLVDRLGEVRLTYAKVHTCEWAWESALTPGDGFDVCDLDTAVGPVKVGAMICFDREFPESARALMLKGAEVILVPNACELEQHRIGQFKARAYENMASMAMANYPPRKANGHSVAFDGVCFSEDGKARDTLLVEGDDSEGVFLAVVDLDRLRAYREKAVWGDAFRRPRLYGALTDEEVQPPFVRPKATR
jgi:N-carbamoylputrescine amidase